MLSSRPFNILAATTTTAPAATSAQQRHFKKLKLSLSIYLFSSFHLLKCVYFRHFCQNIDKYRKENDNKSVDGVQGIQTRDRRIVGADKSTELWQPPSTDMFELCFTIFF